MSHFRPKMKQYPLEIRKRLIFSMLGEASTTEIARGKDAQGFAENALAAKQGGTIAGNARKALEAKSGKRVVSRGNHLAVGEAKQVSAVKKMTLRKVKT